MFIIIQNDLGGKGGFRALWARQVQKVQRAAVAAATAIDSRLTAADSDHNPSTQPAAVRRPQPSGRSPVNLHPLNPHTEGVSNEPSEPGTLCVPIKEIL